ncbi:MAG TPA: VWA domain-containing protein [Gemmataceae bacterium]|nr:VWA domain-containing protein [Gemmataceae bacterium]
MRTGLALALALLPAPLLADAPAERAKPVDVVLCLDTSGSMDGLIDSAKIRLWALVNGLAKMQPAPALRVALYSYGNNTYDRTRGWVRKEVDLTTDLDEVYKRVHALRTAAAGSEEYVARVTRDALAEMKWADDKDALRVLFVCGNEPVDQDKEVSLESVAARAKAQGVLINTIYCGSANHVDATGWAAFAARCGGKYASIDQDRARAEVVIRTPFDVEIEKLGVQINDTYCWYGVKGEAGRTNQLTQDKNAADAAGGASVERGVTKATRLYRNAEADLIDRMKSEKDFDLKKLKEAELPEELRKLKPQEREAYLKKKADERADIQKKITDLSAQRAKYIEDEKRKQPKPAAEKALDEALRAIIRDQAATKGMKVKD